MAIQYPELTIEDSVLSEIHKLEEKVPNVPRWFWNRYFNLSLHNAVLHWQEEHEQCYNCPSANKCKECPFLVESRPNG